jgi:DNA processing protein
MPVGTDQYLGWVALVLTPGLGPRTAGRLLRVYGGPEGIFRASLTELESHRLPVTVAQEIFSQRPLGAAAEELKQVEALGCKLLHWDESEYPHALLQIFDPPPLLYVLGNIEVLGKYSLSIVGARRPSTYGNLMSERLGRDLAVRGLVVVSGLARGIDACAHLGALSTSGGQTVAVLGTGVDVVYPKENKKLFGKIQEQGAVISEFPLGTFAGAQNFPIRNRVIAGMSLGTICVEGGEYSGSLITSRLAMEFGREVFAVPGNVTQPTAFGPNLLIKQGAKLVTGWEDVVEELPTAVRAEILSVKPVEADERNLLVQDSLSPGHRLLYGLLKVDFAVQIDELVESSGLTSSEVLASLFELELKGLVRQLPGKQFLKVLL